MVIFAPPPDLADCERVHAEIAAEFPQHLAVHNLLIQKLDPSSELRTHLPCVYIMALLKCDDFEPLRAQQHRIIELADRVIAGTDAGAFLQYFGSRLDSRPDAAKIKS